MQVISKKRGTIKLKLKLLSIYTFYVCIFLSCWFRVGRAGEPLSNTLHQSYELRLNQALEIPVSEAINSVVLASPDIADILLQTGLSVFVTGKKIGTTNLFLRDRAQNTVIEVRLHVVPEDNEALSIFLGQIRNDYSCLDSCRKISTSGDGVPPSEPSAQK